MNCDMQAGNWLLYSEYANYEKDVVAGSVEYHGHNSSNKWYLLYISEAVGAPSLFVVERILLGFSELWEAV